MKNTNKIATEILKQSVDIEQSDIVDTTANIVLDPKKINLDLSNSANERIKMQLRRINNFSRDFDPIISVNSNIQVQITVSFDANKTNEDKITKNIQSTFKGFGKNQFKII